MQMYIGRRKYSDLELDDDEKDPRAHNMFTQDDRLLEYSTALKGQLFFIPSKELMGRIAEGELF